MYYEYRTYLMRLGEEDNYINTLLEWRTAAQERGHDFKVFGPFKTMIGEENEVSYFFLWDSLAALEKAWTDIYKDEELLKVGLPWWEREEKEGPLMIKVDSELLQLMSDEPPIEHKADLIYEYRVYTFKTSEKHRMSVDGGLAGFFALVTKYGFKTFGPFKPKFGCENQMSYFFIWESLADREKAYEAFANDPDIDKTSWYVREQNEGPLRTSCVSKLMKSV